MATSPLAIMYKAEAIKKMELILAPHQRPSPSEARQLVRLDGDAMTVGMSISDRLGEVFQNGILTFFPAPF